MSLQANHAYGFDTLTHQCLVLHNHSEVWEVMLLTNKYRAILESLFLKLRLHVKSRVYPDNVHLFGLTLQSLKHWDVKIISTSNHNDDWVRKRWSNDFNGLLQSFVCDFRTQILLCNVTAIVEFDWLRGVFNEERHLCLSHDLLQAFRTLFRASPWVAINGPEIAGIANQKDMQHRLGILGLLNLYDLLWYSNLWERLALGAKLQEAWHHYRRLCR